MKILKTIFTVFLYLLLILFLLAVVGCVLLIPRIYAQWSWGSCFMLLFGVVGAIWFIRWLMLSRRRDKARSFVEGVTEISSPQVAQTEQQTASLRKCWQRAMDELGKYATGRKAVYEFPWFVMLGESGSGKSESLKGSRLRMSNDSSDAVAKSPFNLLVMKNTVYLDINGRLLDSREESGVWAKLAAQICRRRPKEPVNGIVICVKATMLSGPASGEIAKTAQRLRDAVSILQNNSQYRLPVYIMITQSDSLPGFSRLAQVLPAQRRQQAMGLLNDDPYGTPAQEFVTRTLAKLCDVMSDLRVEMAYNVGDDSELVMLPASVASLSEGLRQFAAEFFDFNRKDEIPPLRGIFLGSAAGEDTTQKTPGEFYYHEMGLSAPADEKPKNVPSQRGEPLFLHDFFGEVLGANRWLYSPLPSFARLQAMRRSLPLTIFLCVVFMACLVLTLSFLRESHLLHSFSKDVVAPQPVSQAKNIDPLIARIDELKAYSSSIQKLRNLNSSVWWSMLRQSFVQQQMMEKSFAKHFRKNIIDEIDRRMNTSSVSDQADRNNSSVLTGAYFEFVLSRINLDRLSALGRVNQSTFDTVSTPAYSAVKIVAKDLPADRAHTLDTLYQYYYMWGDDYTYLAGDSEKYSSKLVRMVEQGNDSLLWLVDWINVEDDLSDITLNDFWGGDPYKKSVTDVIIGRAYTARGKQRLLNTLDLMHQAVLHTPMNDPRRQRINSILKKEEEELAVWYNQQVYASWLAFMKNFSQGKASITNEEKFNELATRATAMQGPYMQFIDRCTSELPKFCGNDYDKMPSWLKLLMRFKEWKLQAPFNSMLQNSSLVQSSKSFFSGVWDKAKDPQGTAAPQAPQANMEPATLFAMYKEYLAMAAPVAGPLRRKDAYNNLKTVFEIKYPPADAAASAGGGGGGGAQAPTAPAPAAAAGQQEGQQKKLPALEGAHQSFSDLKKAVIGSDGTDTSAEAVWNLLYGSFDLVMDWYCYETAEYLQAGWNKGVLAPSAAVIDSKKPLSLFNLKDGLVWGWQKNNGAPFVTSNSSGDYINNDLYGYSLPLSGQLLEMFNTASKGAWGIQDEYTVNVSCLPTDVNPRSYEMPASVSLVMYTAQGPQTLKNVNLHASKTYKWKPADGGTVELQINFSSFMLVKRYSGDYGFAAFIEEFKNGSWTFMDKDFPQSEQLLCDMNISWIRVNFTFEQTQIEPILRMIKLINLQAPAQIVTPFNRFIVEITGKG